MVTRKNSAGGTETTDTLNWLMARGRKGLRRIETLSWGRLARVHRSRKTGPAIRRAIEREARRCGYRPATILGLNAWN